MNISSANVFVSLASCCLAILGSCNLGCDSQSNDIPSNVNESSRSIVEKLESQQLSDSHIRTEPRQITPTNSFQSEISTVDLELILSKVQPFSPKPFPSIVMATHALRLWGSTKLFDEGVIVPDGYHFKVWRFSCPTLLNTVLDHGKFREYFPNGDPLLMPSPHGITVRFKTGNFLDRQITTWPDCEAHIDKVLSVLGEVGISSNQVVKAPGKEGCVRDIVRDAAMRVEPTQELEFTLKGLLYYLDLPANWQNRFGRRIELSKLICEIASKVPSDGACLGIHVTQVVALAIRIDDEEPFLGADREFLLEYLRNVCRSLERSQLPSGAWPGNWSLKGRDWVVGQGESNEAQQIRATGHHLEWIAIAPSTLRPDEKVIIKAIRFLSASLKELDADNYYHNYTPLTHAARSLVLLSGYDLGKYRNPIHTKPVE